MKKVLLLLTVISFFSIENLWAQTAMKMYKAGHVFNVSLPEYMSKTNGLNSAAAIQYKNVVKDVYGLIIFDTKEELSLLDMHYSSIKEFYDDFIEDFLIEEEKRTVSKPKASTKGEINFIEVDVTYLDKEANAEIYYLVGIVETKGSFYKVISWASKANKDKFKSDFQKILYSLND